MLYECELTDAVDLNDPAFLAPAARLPASSSSSSARPGPCSCSCGAGCARKVFKSWLLFWQGSRGWTWAFACLATVFFLVVTTLGHGPGAVPGSAARVFYSLCVGVVASSSSNLAWYPVYKEVRYRHQSK